MAPQHAFDELDQSFRDETFEVMTQYQVEETPAKEISDHCDVRRGMLEDYVLYDVEQWQMSQGL